MFEYTVGENHPFRQDARFGGIMRDDPPPSRNNHEMIQDAKKNESWRGPKNAAPWKQSGIQTLSPLSFLPGFDMVWDICPDMMHLNDNVFSAHIFPLLSGKRDPSKPNTRTTWSDAENRRLERKWEDQMKEHSSWKLSADVQKVFFLSFYIFVYKIFF